MYTIFFFPKNKYNTFTDFKIVFWIFFFPYIFNHIPLHFTMFEETLWLTYHNMCKHHERNSFLVQSIIHKNRFFGKKKQWLYISPVDQILLFIETVHKYVMPSKRWINQTTRMYLNDCWRCTDSSYKNAWPAVCSIPRSLTMVLAYRSNTSRLFSERLNRTISNTVRKHENNVRV